VTVTRNDAFLRAVTEQRFRECFAGPGNWPVETEERMR
jgi:hypothetical protein